MLVYYFVPFIVSNRYLLFRVSNGHNSVNVQNRTHAYMNLFNHKDLGKHLLQLCSKVVKHPAYCWRYFVFTLCSTFCDILLVKYVLYFHINTSNSMFAVHNMALLCISLISYFPGMLLRYSLSDFELFTVDSVVTSITFAFKFQSAEFLLWGVYNIKVPQLLS